MILIAATELLLGYMLFYAAVHNGGQYALSPWDAFTD